MRVLLAALLVGIVGCGGGEKPPGGNEPTVQTAETDIVAVLKKLGIDIEQNEQGEVVGVIHGNTRLTDHVLADLSRLTKLERLNLDGAKVTDGGLAHLKELTALRSLGIGGYESQITDAGLVHLKGLAKLRRLNLWRAEITDAGLEHLRGLTNLKVIMLIGTKVTDAGVTDLQKALPNCNIST